MARPDGHRLEEGERGALVEGGDAEDVEGAQQVGDVGAVPGEDDAVGDAERRRLLAQLAHQVAVARDQDARPGERGENARRGLEEEAVALLGVEAPDRAEDQGLLGNPELPAHPQRALAGNRGELVERRAVPDEAHALLGDEALLDQEVAGGAADRDRAVRAAAQEAVGEGLVGGHPGVGEVLVEDELRPRRARGEAAEVGGGVAVHVQDARPALAGERDEVAQDPRVEAPAAEVVDGDALRARATPWPARGA